MDAARQERKLARRRGKRIMALFYRDAASDMGGLLIKVCQLLSARADLFPPAFTQALRGLQDEVPGVEADAIRAVVEAEFGKPIGVDRRQHRRAWRSYLQQLHLAGRVVRPLVELKHHAHVHAQRRDQLS